METRNPKSSGAAGHFTSALALLRRDRPFTPPLEHRKTALTGLMRPTLAALLLLMTGIIMSLHAQGYSVNWYNVACGGGTSTGSGYSLSATIGQHDAGGPLTGGAYSLTSGYWSLISAVQTAGLPYLTITLIGPNNIIVSWPNTGGYTLQQNANLATGSWITSGYSVTTVNGTNNVSITSPTGNLFFRLKQ